MLSYCFTDKNFTYSHLKAVGGLHQNTYPSCSPRRAPCWSRWMFPEGAVAHGKPALEQGKIVRRKGWRRGTTMLYVACPPVSLCFSGPGR